MLFTPILCPAPISRRSARTIAEFRGECHLLVHVAWVEHPPHSVGRDFLGAEEVPSLVLGKFLQVASKAGEKGPCKSAAAGERHQHGHPEIPIGAERREEARVCFSNPDRAGLEIVQTDPYLCSRVGPILRISADVLAQEKPL